MGYERILGDEIARELDRLQTEGKPWVANWITHAIVGRHEDELAPDAHFWRHCGYASTRDAVRRAINTRAGDKAERDTMQMRLPGYEHLHAYYVVKRKGTGDIGVPIHAMTDREIDEKIVRYEAMSVACRDHAEELREFKKARRSQRRRDRRVGEVA
ncbi:hypothetical protein ACWGNZ_00760 [Sphingomonas zeae]